MGERIFHYWRSIAAVPKCIEYRYSERVLADLSGYDGICLSGISLAIFIPASLQQILNELNAFATAGASNYFDCNYRPHAWKSAAESIEVCRHMNRINDIVFLTTEEVEMVPEEAADQEVLDRFHKSGTREVVV